MRRYSGRIRTVICVILCCIAASCYHDNRRLDGYLEKAEKILDTAPDSTVYRLLYDSIDESILSSATNRQMATYWYLLARMSHELSVNNPRDFFISGASRYFSTSEPSALGVKALSLHSELLRNAGNYSYAVVPALQAYKSAVKLGDENLRILAESGLADAFGGAPGVRDAMAHLDCLIDFIGEVEDTERLISLSKIIFYESSRADGGKETADSRVAGFLPDVVSEIDSSFGRLGLYAVTGEFEKAEVYGDSLLEYLSGREEATSVCADVANLKAELGKYDEASALIAVARENLAGWRDSLHYWLAVAKLAERSGMVPDEKGYKNMVDSLFDVRYGDLVWQSLFLRLRNVYEAETDMALVEQTKTRKQLVVSVIVIVFCLTSGILFYRYRIQKKNAEINRKITEVMLLTREVEEAKADNMTLGRKVADQSDDILRLTDALSEKDRLSVMVGNLLRGRFSHLNTIINEYSGVKESEENYFVFYKNIEYELDKIRRPKNIAEIERMVDECKYGIIRKLREQMPEMKERDVTFVSLTLAGLNARAIGLFLGIHGNSTYKLKKQIVKQISQSGAKDKDWFVSEIENV